MGITGQTPQAYAGGTFTTGGAKGDYHCRVDDAQITVASTGRLQFVLDLSVHNDPDHPGKEGKKLKKMFQSLAMPEDDKEKADQMRGMLKRFYYDGFGEKWPTDSKPIEARKWIGKEAWVRLDVDKDKPEFTKVTHIAQNKEGLPTPKGQGVKTAPEGAPAAGTTPRGRRS